MGSVFTRKSTGIGTASTKAGSFVGEKAASWLGLWINSLYHKEFFMTVSRAWLAWDSLLLFFICTLDMSSTLYWVHTGAASEANPWMAFCLVHGDAAFCAAKMLSFLPLLAFAAYYRPRRPRLIAISLRGTVLLYLGVYAVAVGSQWLH